MASADNDEEEVAFLLTECSRIATREVACEPPLVKPIVDQLAKTKALPAFNETVTSTAVSFDQEDVCHRELGERDEPDKSCLMARNATIPPSLTHPTRDEDDAPILLQWRNLRGESVSPPHAHSTGILSTPPASPFVFHDDTSTAIKKSTIPTGGRPRSVSFPVDSILEHRFSSPGRGNGKEIILRKKFSWRHYPVLEHFLIANRAEYLRHSAMNYTLAQKKFNNKLTERTIKLANQHGYEFDAREFNFVDIRDRIRCYFKSYVQSMKKKGLDVRY